MKINSRYQKSYQLWEKGKKSLIQGSITLSKDPNLYTFGAYPVYLKSGHGAIVRDIDGNTYIDFQSGLGAIILGHAYKPVVKAISAQLRKGSLQSLAHPLTVELAQRIQKVIPGAERVRIVKSGSDATTLAVRIARAYTGKDKIFACHFHGWHDWYYILSTTNNRGIPGNNKENVFEAPYNDLAKLEEMFAKYHDTVAAIILEPVSLVAPKENFLADLIQLAHKHHALVIFDEVITGFRFAHGGAQAYYHVTPDLCCFAKAIGNGMPIGLTCGLKDIMEKTADVASSMTFGEEAATLAGSLAILDVLEHEPVSEHIWKLGTVFQKGFNQITRELHIPVECIGLPPRLELVFKDYSAHKRLELKAYFLQETARHGILFGNMIFINYSHTEGNIQKALNVAKNVLTAAVRMGDKPYPLKGKLPVELW